MPPATHGGLDFAELRRHGLSPEDVLDFSANTNPYGACPRVRDAIARASVEAYPDRDSLALREVLAQDLNLSPAEILPANGASEVIWLIALAFLRPHDRTLILGPTYGEYARACALMGASATTLTAGEAAGFLPDEAEISRSLRRLQPRAVFICNPNNPTGSALSSEAIIAWARAHRRTLFVVDEAYLAFTRETSSVVAAREKNVLVVRSMTKDFGLAGLRLGYAVSCEQTIGWLKRVQPPWSVNAAAQLAGVAALHDRVWLQRSLQRLSQAAVELRDGLAELGFVPVPSATHFFLVRVGDGAAFRSSLLKVGILVRDCASFGLPAYVRIAARRPEENARLVTAVGKLAGQGGYYFAKDLSERARNGKPRAGRIS